MQLHRASCYHITTASLKACHKSVTLTVSFHLYFPRISKVWSTICCRGLKSYFSFHIRKHLAKSLTLSKLDYCNILFDNIPTFMKNRLQKVQNATAVFVLDKCTKIKETPCQNYVLSGIKIANDRKKN